MGEGEDSDLWHLLCSILCDSGNLFTAVEAQVPQLENGIAPVVLRGFQELICVKTVQK